ncbi:MAG: hypothetical protein KDM91_17870 [Verrucomicrobiae bacterium]|nr:hypothetical protein [Verrucomicrobiae bacterium]MCP5541404.1 hypothetical protein [Akkermansiaceae bacterium]
MFTTIIVLSLVGILALLAEMVLPGGVIGVVGALCLLVAVILVFVEYGLWPGTLASVGLAIFGFTIFTVWMRHFHRLPFTREMVLKETLAGAGTDRPADRRIGQVGEALTDLRPSGRVRIEGERVDAVAESGVIEKGAAVRVVGTDMSGVIVREA